MTKRPTRPYARVYYDQLQQEFPAVWNDHGLLGAWVHLLIRAERIWPVPADRPRRFPPARWAALVKVGLIQPVGGDQYRVLGLDAERKRRHDVASLGGRTRWGSGSNADDDPEAMPTDSDSNANGHSPAMPTDSDSTTNEMPSTRTRTSTRTRRLVETVDNTGRARPRRPRRTGEGPA